MRSRDTLRTPVRRPLLPKGVWFQRKVLSNGEIVRYGYYGRGVDTIALGREGSAEFHERLAQALRRGSAERTVAGLILQYRQSPEFTSRKPRTQADYILQLDKIGEEFGKLSLRAMGSRQIAQHIYAWRDSRAASARQADYGIQVLKVLLAWGTKRGLLEQNRAAGVGKIYAGNRSESVWSDDQITAFLGVASEPLRRAITLALETGQRQADLLSLSWGAVGPDTIRLKQQKTGTRAAIPISAALRRCLDETPRSDATTVLTKADGMPWGTNGNGFRSAWREAAKVAGIKGVTFHDLRGTFVTRRLSEGWTVEQVAMCTGHSLRDLVSLERYAHREFVADASAQGLAKRATSAGRIGNKTAN
jgi:integrase